MARTPEPAHAPRIRGSLRAYRVLAWITGLFLLLLVVEMILKYGAGLEFELGGAHGFVALVPSALLAATNLSVLIQITHGYIYIVYLICAFLLVNWLRWPTLRFVLIALGGVVPLLSFFVEHRVTRQVREVLETLEAAEPPAATATAPATTRPARKEPAQ